MRARRAKGFPHDHGAKQRQYGQQIAQLQIRMIQAPVQLRLRHLRQQRLRLLKIAGAKPGGGARDRSGRITRESHGQRMLTGCREKRHYTDQRHAFACHAHGVKQSGRHARFLHRHAEA